MPKYPSSTMQMTKDPVQSETELSLVRKETSIGDSVTYIFALGLKIMSTAKGVTFAGSSTVLSPEQLKGVARVVKKATKIHTELAAGRGLVPEDELDGKMRLRCMMTVGQSAVASYCGTKHRAKASTLAGAVSELRSQYNATKKG